MADRNKYRYPGVVYFKTDDEDIFCGRTEDTRKLYTQIMLSKTVVLHAESGVGKSSLIQAGIIPFFQNNNPKFIPITIRFDGKKSPDNVNDDFLILETIKCIKKQRELKELSLPYIKADENNLWYITKMFEKNGHSLLLIFDQFEELQGYNYKQIDLFKKKLSELFCSNIPYEINNEIEKNTSFLFGDSKISDKKRNEYNNNIEFLEHPLSVKALFVVREDKLGVMNLLSDYFPDILKNDYLLLPLDNQNARKAISDPAEREGEYLSPKFEIDNEAVKHLLLNLADTDTGRIDPIQIQIICRNIERKILPKKQKENIIEDKKHKIFIDDLPPIGNILNDFYKEIWSEVKQKFKLNDNEFNKIRKEINTELIIDKKRNLVHEGKLIKIVNEKEIINYLVEEGLLNRIHSDKDTYYQLCHDRLIVPVEDELGQLIAREKAEILANERINTLKKKIFVPILLVLLMISIGLTLIYKSQKSKAEEEKAIYIFKNIRKSDPTLSYIVARDWHNRKYKHSDKFVKFLGEFDSTKAFLVGTFPISPSIISAQITSDNKNLNVTERASRSSWDIKKGILINYQLINDGEILASYEINKKNFLVVRNDDNYQLEIRNEKDKIEKKFYYDVLDYYAGNDIAVSGDGKYILIENKLHSLKTAELIGEIDRSLFTNSDLKNKLYYPANYIFFHDNKHIAVGYSNGYIAIFRIDEKNKEKIKFITIYYSPEYAYNSITSLAIDHKDKRLIAGYSNNDIVIWSLEDYNDKAKVEAIKESKPKLKLKGHSSEITYLNISRNDSLVLSGSNDHSAILWDLKSGKSLAVLKGDDANVVYTGFSEDGNQMITGTDGGFLFIWKKDKISLLYEKQELARFSPFHFYIAGLEKDVFQYDTIGIKNLFSSTLHYLISLPVKNQYPGDLDHLISIQKSLKEVKDMYRSLIQNPKFDDSISIFNKALLFQKYNLICFKEPELLLKTQNENQEKYYERIGKHHIESIKMLLLDTADINLAYLYINDLVDIATFYIDSYKDNDSIKYYQNAITCLKNAQMLNDAFLHKFTKATEYRSEPEIYNKLSNTYLYLGKIDSAELFFKRVIESDSFNESKYYFDYAFLLFKTGYKEKSKEYFEKAVSSKKTQVVKYNEADNWGDLSWYYLFTGNYKKAEDAAIKGLEIGPKDYTIWIYTNLMHAYLFQNEFEKAKSILMDYKDSNFSGSQFKEIILKDYEDFRKVNMSHPDMKKIEDIIKSYNEMGKLEPVIKSNNQ